MSGIIYRGFEVKVNGTNCTYYWVNDEHQVVEANSEDECFKAIDAYKKVKRAQMQSVIGKMKEGI